MVLARTKVSIVDDEDSVRKSLGRLLRLSGMDVETYSCGAEFIAALQTRHFDCVVLDLHMPTMSGFEVMARLARMEARVPVVVVTGDDASESAARAAGASAYLFKPVDGYRLIVAINDAVSKNAV